MGKYRFESDVFICKPAFERVEAWQFMLEEKDVPKWVEAAMRLPGGGLFTIQTVIGGQSLIVETWQGRKDAQAGDFIIMGATGKLDVVREGNFKNMYKPDDGTAVRPASAEEVASADEAAKTTEQIFREAMLTMQKRVHDNAVGHGFHLETPTIPEQLMLMVTELAEAMESYRREEPMLFYECRDFHGEGGSDGENYQKPCKGCRIARADEPCPFRDKKPQGIAIELGDVVLRVMDTCEELQIDLGDAMLEKHHFNLTRPFKHGKKL